MLVEHVPEWHQQRRRALGRVQHAVVRGRELLAVHVGAGRREQRIDLAPGEEHHARQDHEHQRVMGKLQQCVDADAFQHEGDEHRVLAADIVGNPAEERPREAVEHAVDRERERQRGQGEPEDRDRHVVDLEVLGDRGELRGRHQAAGSDHHEHHVHDPERRRLQHLGRRKVTPRLLHTRRCRRRRIAAHGRTQEQREQHHDDALADPEPEERGLIAARMDHVRDRHHGERGAGAKTRGRQARGKTAPVGEPLQRVADAGTIDDAGADAAERGGNVEQRQRVGIGVHDPGDGDQHAAQTNHDARAELVDQIAFERHQPRLGDDEDRERDLDRGASPVVFLVDRIDEESPAILQVRDHHHADDAEYELSPARRFGRGHIGSSRRRCRTCRSRHFPPSLLFVAW